MDIVRFGWLHRREGKRAGTRAINCTRSWLQMRTRQAGSPAFEGGAVIAAYGKMQPLPAATTMTSSTDARHSTDATIFACVSAKSLIQKATDARTQLTQGSAPNLHGRSSDVKVTSRRSGHWMTSTARRSSDRTVRSRRLTCGRSRPLIRQASTATDCTDRKKGARFTLLGRERSLRRPECAPTSIRGGGLPDRCSR